MFDRGKDFSRICFENMAYRRYIFRVGNSNILSGFCGSIS